MLDFFNLKLEHFGLDISDGSIKIIKLKNNRGNLELASFGEKKIPKGIIEEGEIKDEASLAKIIREAVGNINGEKIKTKYVACSLPEEKSYLQVIQMPKMPEEEIKQAVKFEAENYIPLPIEKAYFDFQVIKPFYNHLDHLDVLITAIPRKIVDGYISALKMAGLKPIALEIESLAITRALIKDEASPFPILIIDVAATRTGFAVFSGHSLRFTSSIPTSSEDFTEAISKALNIDLSKAEELKRKYGLHGPQKTLLKEKTGDFKFEKEITEDKNISQALLPSLTILVSKIKTHLDYYQAHLGHEHLPSNVKSVEKIMICGGGANLRGLPEFLLRELKIKTEIGNPWANAPKGVSELPVEKSLSFTTAIGLAQIKDKNKK